MAGGKWQQLRSRLSRDDKSRVAGQREPLDARAAGKAEEGGRHLEARIQLRDRSKASGAGGRAIMPLLSFPASLVLEPRVELGNSSLERR